MSEPGVERHRTHVETGTLGTDSNGCADVCRGSMNHSSKRSGESSIFQPRIADSRNCCGNSSKTQRIVSRFVILRALYECFVR